LQQDEEECQMRPGFNRTKGPERPPSHRVHEEDCDHPRGVNPIASIRRKDASKRSEEGGSAERKNDLEGDRDVLE